VHGGSRSECPDDERDWFPQLAVCWPAAQLEAAKAFYADLHAEAPFHDGSFKRWATERSRAFPFHFTDGVSIWLSPVELSPGEDFLNPAGG